MDKKILITGGSSGIGAGLAEYFLEKGWQVLVTGRNEEKLALISAKLKGVKTIIYDSLDKGSENKIISFIKEHWDNQLDVLVNNAGHVAMTPLENIDREILAQMYQAHLIGPTLLTSGCIESLTRTKGQILNITSSHGIKAYPQLSAYASAKSGLNMLTKVWALELAAQGIRVNAIAPGPTETPVLANAGLDQGIIESIRESEKTSIPLQRRGEVSDIVSIASGIIESASWLTGTILPVDGGVSIS